jgi:3-isopropylmalate/(R)-2-methylmalate dehydratase small subunit
MKFSRITVDPALECPGVRSAFTEGQTAEVTLEDFTVRIHETGTVLKALPVPRMLLDMMLGGGLYPHLERGGLIAPRYLNRRPAR